MLLLLLEVGVEFVVAWGIEVVVVAVITSFIIIVIVIIIIVVGGGVDGVSGQNCMYLFPLLVHHGLAGVVVNGG